MSSHKGKAKSGTRATVTDLSQLEALGGDGLAGLDAMRGPASLAALEAAGTAEDDADPIGELDYANMTNEEVATAETSAVLEAFKARAKNEKDRFALVTDSEYWVGVCFQTREQKEAFLAAVQLLQHGDKYIDGQLLAERIGVKLPPAAVPYNTSSKVDAKYAALVKDL